MKVSLVLLTFFGLAALIAGNWVQKEGEDSPSADVLKVEIEVERLKYGNRSYIAFQTEITAILEPRRQEDVPRALNKLLAAVVFLLRYILITACADLLSLFDALYWILDCVFEISAIDVCTTFYSCKVGIIPPSAIGATDFDLPDESGRKGKGDKVEPLRRKRENKYPQDPKEEGKDDQSPRGGDSKAARFFDVYFGTRNIYTWTSYLFKAVEEIVRPLSHILGAPRLVLCPHRRYPKKVQALLCIGAITAANYKKYLELIDYELMASDCEESRPAYYLGRSSKIIEGELGSASKSRGGRASADAEK